MNMHQFATENHPVVSDLSGTLLSDTLLVDILIVISVLMSIF